MPSKAGGSRNTAVWKRTKCFLPSGRIESSGRETVCKTSEIVQLGGDSVTDYSAEGK